MIKYLNMFIVSSPFFTLNVTCLFNTKCNITAIRYAPDTAIRYPRLKIVENNSNKP